VTNSLFAESNELKRLIEDIEESVAEVKDRIHVGLEIGRASRWYLVVLAPFVEQTDSVLVAELECQRRSKTEHFSPAQM